MRELENRKVGKMGANVSKSGAVFFTALALASLVSGVSDSALAQQSMFGNASLRSGFLPDPHSLNGQSGGNVDASGVNGGCNGFISPHPSHVVTLTSAFRWMRIFVESQGDTTIMVQTPQNTVLCNDDTYGLNPAVEGGFQPGTYRIWVGSYSQSSAAPYTIRFTEIGCPAVDRGPNQPNVFFDSSTIGLSRE